MQSITPLTPQQVFDNALFGVRKQRYHRSIRGAACAYRGNNGRKCGIGHSIPDELYHESFDDSENFAVGVLSILGADRPACQPLKELFQGCNLKLLVRLQSTHDESYREKQFFEANMKVVAEEFGLTYTPPVD